MTAGAAELERRIAALADQAEKVSPDEARGAVAELLEGLDAGSIRAAEKENGDWVARPWVKRGILLGFRVGGLVPAATGGAFPFFDKDTFPLKRLTVDSGVRVVPGGTAIRAGCYVAPGVTIMPPAYVNVGAYVDTGTLIDSHALVGSCAQIGRRVHISAGAQIGGVLEPAGALPVIVEDDVLIGGSCGIYEGAVVRRGAILAAGVVLTGSTPVYDVARGAIYRREAGRPLEIPEGAVVVPGARAIREGRGSEWGLALQTPVVVKYRDAKTDGAVELEELLR
jgi:2,3,4,5-tetrahydropyridine-2-carboxylate N-succinyltransferase